MFVRLLSDLHLEFGGNFQVPEQPEDKDTVLVLAGDIGLVDKPYTFQKFVINLSFKFRDIILILGNHEYYKESFVRAVKTEKSFFLDYKNVHVLENETLTIDDVSFVCSTMWTNFNNADPIVMNMAQNVMNDYALIRTGHGYDDAPYNRKLQPVDTYIAHEKAVKYIFPAIKKEKEKRRKVVVVTHHLPSYMSIHEQYKNNALANSAYVTELFEQICEANPDYWLHGHTHSSSDYKIENTRVLANPKGYYNIDSNPDFDPNLRFEV